MASDSQTFSLEELLKVASEELGEEISQRTVRLYATQGLIDRPGKDGRSAIYERRQLLQLVLIRFLARRGLSLSAIAPLAALPNEEMQLQILSFDKSAEEKFKASLISESREQDSGKSNPLLQLLGAPLKSTALPDSNSSAKNSRTRLASSRWSRFTLAPGVELHISDSASIPPSGSRRITWIQRLTDRLIEQLEETKN
ncbi:MerR family transcriptional regulator [Prochlorococcus sp. MIT 1341]|uniref:MerR family transcriptional regulator n=1 Tax=Prochlorococcus sp. MIT 1341 TaxID=3096221 RepID=UPI002A750D13|nr:MerR family transcriptional regulator [Prochlorococcus sp. MIT 1341]